MLNHRQVPCTLACTLALIFAILTVLFLSIAGLCAEPDRNAKSAINAKPKHNNFRSSFYAVEAALNQPALVRLAVDSLGQNKLNGNALWSPMPLKKNYRFSSSTTKVKYRIDGSESNSPPQWSFSFTPKIIQLCSTWKNMAAPDPLALKFNPKINHVTLIGLLTKEGRIKLPTLLHFPGEGTFRITSNSTHHG